jgi:hypothetical protein
MREGEANTGGHREPSAISYFLKFLEPLNKPRATGRRYLELNL